MLVRKNANTIYYRTNKDLTFILNLNFKYVIIYNQGSDSMHTPNLVEARKRTNNKVLIKTDDYKLNDNQKKLGKNKKYFIKTYGCQMNEHDSENISAILSDMGYEIGRAHV